MSKSSRDQHILDFVSECDEANNTMHTCDKIGSSSDSCANRAGDGAIYGIEMSEDGNEHEG